MRVILCASDAGGARNLAPLLPVLGGRGVQASLITSVGLLSLFEPVLDWAAQVITADSLQWDGLGPHLAGPLLVGVICGTTRYASPDRRLVTAARLAGVRSVCVLDEWFNYRQRFVDEASGDVALPDRIAVQDDLARREAVEEGIPESLCCVTGSPALAELAQRAESFRAVPPQLPAFLGPPHRAPVVTFLSETHAADYGAGPGERGPLGPFLGYSEVTVWGAILRVLGRLARPVTLVEKLHPSAQEGASEVPVPANVRRHVTRDADLWSLLWYSDLVVGMRSMALLEAALLGCRAVSFQPALIGPQQCTAVRLGAVPAVDQEGDLLDWCSAALSLRRNLRGREMLSLPAARADAADRVVCLALGEEVRQ